jgi:hypothetical protein
VTIGANDRADQPLRHRKARDRALILPLAGLVLLIPPVAGVFHIDAKIAGVPFTLVYLFAVWALLIAGAAALSRRLRDGGEPGTPPEAQDATEQQDTVEQQGSAA